jgi:hypothetical protein
LVVLDKTHDEKETNRRSVIFIFTRVGAMRSGHRATLTVLCLVLAAAALPSAHAKSRLPLKKFDRDVLCEACGATLVELDGIIAKTEKKLGRGSAIVDALESVCDDVYTFTRYAFPPPKMQKGCQAIVEALEDEIDAAFASRLSPEEAKLEVCAEACEGVDQTAKTSGTSVEEMYVDGKPHDGRGEAEL